VLKKLHVKLFLIQASKAVNLITSTEVGRLSRRRGGNIISSLVIQLPSLLFSVSNDYGKTDFLAFRQVSELHIHLAGDEKLHKAQSAL
jgi:hypothetical protein